MLPFASLLAAFSGFAELGFAFGVLSIRRNVSSARRAASWEKSSSAMTSPTRKVRMNRPDIFPPVSESHAAAIGHVAINWSSVEASINHVIAGLLGLHWAAGHAVTAELPGQAALNLLTVLVGMTGNPEWVAQWQTLTQRIAQLRPKRNDAVHAEWQVSGASHLARRLQAKKKLKFRLDYIPTESLDRLADECLILAEDIGKFRYALIIGRASEFVLSQHPAMLHFTYPATRYR